MEKNIDEKALGSTGVKDVELAGETPVDSRSVTGSVRRPDGELENVVKAPPAFTFPDGGRKAWATVLGAWLVSFSTFGFINAFGVFEDFYVREFLTQHTPSDISWIGSVQLFVQFSSGIIVGKLFDEGYFHHIMISGSTLYVFSVFMLSLAQENQFYQVFLSQGIAAGIGLGAMFLPSIGIVSHHFQKRRSLAMGIVVTGSSCGGIVFPIMLNNLFQQIGFAWGVRVAAFIILGCLLLANFLMTTRLPPKSQRPPAPPVSLALIIRDIPYMISIPAAFLILIGLYLPFFYIQLFAITRGIDPTLAFYALAIINAASIFGRILPNFLADIFGIFNMLIPLAIISAVLIFVMLAVVNDVGVILFSIFYGFASGAYISLIGPMLSSLSNHVGEVGIRMGFAFTFVGIGGLIGTPINGALLTSDYIWWQPVVFSGLCVFVGALLLCVTRHMTAQRRSTWKV